MFCASARKPKNRTTLKVKPRNVPDLRQAVPEISRFLGIVIGMFYKEHGVAHFHAVYGEYEASIEVESGKVHGELPPRALRLVLEWAALHKAELLDDWQLARQGQPLKTIAPLE